MSKRKDEKTEKQYEEVKDSGERQSFSTGAVRDTQEGKGRFDLIPTVVLRRLAKHYENGARKYRPWNWAKGIPLSRYYDSGLRHAMAWAEGKDDEDHLAAVIWNFAAILHHEDRIRNGRLPKELANAGPLSFELDLNEEECEKKCK